jgi:hypothetical protein
MQCSSIFLTEAPRNRSYKAGHEYGFTTPWKWLKSYFPWLFGQTTKEVFVPPACE